MRNATLPVVRGSLTTGAEITLPSRRIASCFSSALPVTSPSLPGVCLVELGVDGLPRPLAVEGDGCGRHDAQRLANV